MFPVRRPETPQPQEVLLRPLKKTSIDSPFQRLGEFHRSSSAAGRRSCWSGKHFWDRRWRTNQLWCRFLWWVGVIGDLWREQKVETSGFPVHMDQLGLLTLGITCGPIRTRRSTWMNQDGAEENQRHGSSLKFSLKSGQLDSSAEHGFL